MRKVLGSISLLVLLLNTLLTPVTYAGEYEEILETSGESVTEEVVEETGEEEVTPEFSVEEENGEEGNDEENIEEEEIETEETEEDETTTGDVAEEGTGDTEGIETGATEELTGDNEELTGEIAETITGTIVEEGTGCTEELTGGVVEEIGTGENEDIEYNKESIIGERTYNDVTVKVEALSGIFPEGTELKIEPIRWWNLSNLKDKLVEEQAEVKEDTTVVAFDITFIYSGEEVQPKEGEKVKVTFDYSKNEDLVEADKDETQSVKVYHIEDKDEEGNELEEEGQKIIDVTNKEESEEEGIAVADGERFSIYAVLKTNTDATITYNLNGGYWTEEGIDSTGSKEIEYTSGNPVEYFKTPSKAGNTCEGKKCMFDGWYTDQEGTIKRDGNPNTTTVYAKWLPYEDLYVYMGTDNGSFIHRTLMDRNMGATELYGSSNTEATLGYHYQRGNNYGFPAKGNISDITYIKAQNNSVPKNIRLKGIPSKYYRNYYDKNTENWMKDSGNDAAKMWGGYGDTCRQEGSETSSIMRQGPCPDGYHVPSMYEWGELYSGWTVAAGKSKDWGEVDNRFLVANDFLLPEYIERRKGGSFDKFVSSINYQSSSLSSSQTSYGFYMDKGSLQVCDITVGKTNAEALTTSRAVRCIKNREDEASYLGNIYINGGTKGVISISNGEVIALRDPLRGSDSFGGWYTEEDYSGSKIGVGSGIEKGSNLYAKWDCGDGKVDNGSACVQGFKISFNATHNGGITPAEPIIVTNSESDPIIFSEYTAIKTGYDFVGWNTNPNDNTGFQTSQTYTESTILYAIFSTGITATFHANGNKLNNEINDILTGCTLYNKETECLITTPTITNEVTTTVVGYTTSQEGASTSNTGSNTQINISGGEDYYAQTKTPTVILTGAVNRNNSTLSSDEDVSCALDEVYNGGTQDTDCEVTMPTVTAHSNTPTFVGWNTLSSSITNNASYNISSNKLTLTETNKGNTWYAITTAPEVQLSVSYTKGTGVQAIGETLSGCNIEATYNGAQQSSTCTVIAPTITVKAGYNNENKRWEKSGSEEVVSEGATITLTKSESDITYEASTNIITYTIEYEDEFDVTNPNPTEYTIESGDITLIALEKEGYDFIGWYTEPGYINKVTGVAISHGTTGDKKYYAKWEPIGYTITYDAGSHSGTINGEPTKEETVAYNTVITLPTTGTTNIESLKPGYQFIGWTDELGGTSPIAGEQTITDNVTYYPIFKKAPIQYRAVFSGNGAILNGNNAEEITVPCEIPAVYNTGVQDTTCPVTTPSIQRAGYEIKGYHENKDHKDECTIIGNQKIQIDGDMTYYAITKKDLTANFNRNGNTAQTKHGETETTTELIEETCSIWNEGTECKVRTPTITPTTGKTPIGYTTSTTSSGENLTGEDTEITLTTTPVNYYAWTKSTPTEIKISYIYGTGVVTGTDTSGSCIPEVRYNGDETLTGCLIKLPGIEAKTGYTAPKWYRGDTDVVVTTDADNKAMFYYTDGPLTLTAKATVGDKISYVVKHYFQTLENNTGTNKYQLNDSKTDIGLSGEVETILVLSGLKQQVEGFEYFKATVNGQPVEDVIDINQEIDYAETHQLTTPVEIKLLYTRNRYQYTLNEDVNVTTQGSTESVNAFYGQEITLSGGVSNDCYERSGWQGLPNGVANTQETSFTMPASPVTITPVINEKTYTIVFDANAEDAQGIVEPKNVSCTAEVQLDGSEVYTRNGYLFQNWNTKSDGSGIPYAKDATITTALTKTGGATVILYAQWNASGYIVTFDANSGVVSIPTKEVIYNQAYGELPTPTREGYQFTGWYTEKVGGEKVTADTQVTTANDHTLYAQWKVRNYTVTFDANSGEVTPLSKEVTYDGTYGELPIPNRTGYTFIGWYTAKEGGDPITAAIQVATASNHILFAHWEENHYTIAFDANGGDGDMAPIENVPYSESTTLSENVFTRNGYHFIGWGETDSSTTVAYEDKATVKELTGVDNATVTLYALRSKGSYKIDYILNGGALTGGRTNLTGYSVDTASFPLNNPEREGYDFIGWSGTDLTTLTTGVTITQGSIGNRVYEANWSPKTYTISYDLSGGVLTGGQTNPATYTIETASFTLNNPERTGYTFKGWSGTDLTNLTTEVTIAQGSTGNREYVANWEVKTYTITWKNSTGTTLRTETLPYGSTPNYEGTPTSGADAQYTYTFTGWDPSIKTVTEDQVYTATYDKTVRSYTITWLDDGGQEIDTTTVAYGETPTHAGPEKAADAQYTYTFKSWEPTVKPVTGEATYTATYTETTRTYTIIWNNRDGTELHRDEKQPYGTHIGYTGPVPTSGSTAQYTYAHNGWMPTVHNVTGPQVYTATYSQTTNSYPITWKNEDGTEIKTTQVLYGVTPSYTGPELTKEGYRFDKWTPDLEPVVGTASYTATYTVNNYNVTPVKGVGVANILGGGSYPYNTVVTLTGIAKEGYHFEGGVSEKAFTYTVPSHNITPQIDAEPNTYHVHFKPNGGTGVMANQEFVYDVEQELSPNAYTRSGFTFISWTDGEGGYYTDKKKVKNLATTGSVILLAQWFEGDGPTPGPTPTPTPSGGGSSGGGGRRPIDKDTQEHASAAESGDIKEVEDKTQTQTGTTAQTGATKTGTTIQWTEEELTAYQYAYKYGITTLAPEEAAMPDAYVIRGHMAKMVVNYALNVLNRKLPAKMPKQCKWKDGRNAWESQEIKEYAEKACALGLMGIDMDYFQPNKLVTRAQFGTIFGRLLWGKIVSKPYYAGHLARLKKRGIMTQIDRPEERIEVRKWAWLMFMRSEKYFKIDK